MYSPHRVVSTCLALLFLSAALPAFTQQAMPVETPVTVQDAFESALSIDPEVQSALKRIEAFKARRSAASALTAQPLSLEGSYRSDRNYNNQGLREIELGVSAPIWNWNERARTQSLRDTEIELVQLQLEQKKLELAGLVRQTIWNTLAANLDAEISQARLKSAKELMVDVEKRVKAGDLAQTDFYQASALYEQTRAEFARTQSALSDVSADYAATIGLPVSVLSQIQTESTDIPNGLKPLDHPAIKLAQLQVLAQQQQSDLVQTQARANPEVGLAIISDRGAFTSASEKSLVVSTRIPLGNSSEYQSRVLQAESESIAAEAVLTKTQRQIVVVGRAAESNLDLFAQIRVSAQEQAKLAAKTFQLYKKSFDLGETDLPTLLIAEQKAFEADKLARKSAIEYAAKVSAYKQALGLLP
ncbi:TolC family protein [Limnobacter sp.]|jgi:outer membrane protein, heavy metal efflux system|uniref:TolC family protein n=1 Tax=Limnobacter sp. TaxID=2003368 RepID=UPI003BAA4433